MEKTIAEFEKFGEIVLVYGRDILWAMVILIAGLVLAKAVNRMLRVILTKFISNKTLVSSISAIVFVLILVFVVAGAMEQAGMEGIVVQRIIFGITMAIVFLIIIFRPYMPNLPFKVGHFIKTGDLMGKVEATTLTHTRLKTVDGKTVFVPNSKILKDFVINYYFTPERRVEIEVGIGYDQDLIKAKQIMETLLIEDPRIMENPRPAVYVVNLADSCVELSGRGWVKNIKYWKTKCDLIEKVKLRFDQENIKIAFPQRDVHLYHEASPSFPEGEGTQNLIDNMTGET